MGRGSSTSLAPGFRFHPTDEELVRYYLKRKVSGKPLRFDPISEVDVYKSEPWDLPDKSRLKSRDLEWYFFSVLDKKYGNGSKTNRATENGYWKTTGKDRPIRHYSRTVGMKKTLVYHSGRAPRGQRSNWVMHEYRLTDEELEKAGIAQDAFVLCRIFQKSGPGPKNGEQYGAPFVEEEWEDEGMALFPDQQVIAEEVVVEDMNGESNEFDQDVPVGIPIGVAPLSENYGYGSSTNDNEQPGNLDENDQNAPEEDGESQLEAQHLDENKFFVLPQEYDMDVKPVKREYAGPSADDMNLGGGNYLDGTFTDATDNPPFGDELYLNDLSYPVETDPDGFNVEDYLTFFDSDNDDMVANDSSLLVRNDDSASAEHIQQEKEACGENENIPDTYQHPAPFHGHDEASSSRQDKEPEQLKPDFKHAFLKQASHVLGSYPAPPAYASEYPIKDAALRINSAAHASSSVHVTAGMMRIRNLTLSVSGMEWSLGKNGELNVIVSVGLSHDGVRPASTYDSGYKTPSVVSWSWALFLVLWIILLSVSVKLGSPYVQGNMARRPDRKQSLPQYGTLSRGT